MPFRRLIITADSHTQGEPTRLVIGGILHYPGKTMREKQLYAAKHLDSIRKSLMGEPRGHHDMFGGFITPPATETGDLGVIYMDNGGYLDMCGHGTIGLCTVAVELGLVNYTLPRTQIEIDTPAGRVKGYAISENGEVYRAGFHNVPSFCLNPRERVHVQGFGELEVGIAYGGNFFGILPAEAVDLDIKTSNLLTIREIGMRVKQALNEQLNIRHPKLSDVSGVDIVTFYASASNPKATYKNVHVFSKGQVDRSPGGTGTSAMLAYLIALNEITPGDLTVAEGLAGGLFEGRTLKTWEEGGITYHVPDISGKAHLTGIHSFYLDAQDPMGGGFLLAQKDEI